MRDGTMNTVPTVMARLRAETADLHRATERTPLARAMLAGAMTMAEYAVHLAAFRHVLGPLEERLEAEPTASVVAAVYRRSMSRVPDLDADLRALDESAAAEGRALPSVVEYAAHLASASVDSVGLLGHVYVFEGSRHGGQMLLPRLEASLGLTPAMSNYYRGVGPATFEAWQAFLGRMNSAVVERAEQDRVVAAARDAFARIARVFEEIGGPAATVYSAAS